MGANFRRAWNLIALICVCLLGGSAAVAQGGRGSIVGTVTDPQGGSLQGARIVLTPSGTTAESGAAGQFSMVGVPAGTYTVTVTYSGFDAYTGQVSVQAGLVAHMTPVLKVAAAQSSVQVYAGRQGGELEAINRTITADNIINVLPADVIKSLPNANVADAIGRLPSVSLERDEGEGKYVQVRGTEPRLTNVMVDGVNIASAETVRQVKLDIIPSDLVESVQINKTLQANMPGDGIGGSVDLRTKSAEDRPNIRLEATGGHTNIIGGRPAYQIDGSLGKRFFENKLGALVDVSYDWNGRGINDVEPAPLYLGGYDERDYRYYRSRFGAAGTIDYRANDNSSVYLKYLYSLFHNYGDRWDYNFGVSFDPNYQPVAGSGNLSVGAEIRRPIQDLGLIQLGGNHVVNNYVIHWDAESSVGRTRDQGYDDASFSNNNSYNFSVDNSNPYTPKITAAPGVNVYDPTQYTLTGLRINNYYNPEVDLGFGGSIARSYSLAGHASTFEVGGRFRNLHKFANQDTLNRVPNNPNLTLANFPSDFSDSDYYGGQHTFGPAANFSAILAQQFSPDPKHGDLIGNNFNYIEKVSAGYAMDTINLGRWRVVGGLRFEETNTHDAGTTIPDAPTISRDGSYLSVLPSLSVRYGFDTSSGVRLVYSRGVSRPNFSDIISFASIAPGGVRTTSSVGNPNLKAEYADNFDVLYEKNLTPIGLLQGGFFYKHLTNPIVPVTQLFVTTDPTTNSQNYNYLTQAQNGGGAWVYGLEIGFQQHFRYLPGMLNGLGVSANYAYTNSQLTWPARLLLPADPNDPNGGKTYNINRTDKPALLRQAPHTWNISPTYDKRGFSARLGLTYNAANVFSYSGGADNTPFNPADGSGGGLSGPNGDTYLYAHLQIDLEGTYRLPKGFEVVGYGLNLNNEVFGFYNGSSIYPIQREFYQPTFGGGLRWSPRHE